MGLQGNQVSLELGEDLGPKNSIKRLEKPECSGGGSRPKNDLLGTFQC